MWQTACFPGVETGMLLVETVVHIRGEHASGKSINEIARDLLSTVIRALTLYDQRRLAGRCSPVS
jgi:hypothetical protein